MKRPWGLLVVGALGALVACGSANDTGGPPGDDDGGPGPGFHDAGSSGSSSSSGGRPGSSSSSGSGSGAGASSSGSSGSSSGRPSGSSSGSSSSSSSGRSSGSSSSSSSSSSGGSGSSGSPPITLGSGKKFVGNISTRGQIRSDFAMFWNQFSPENEGKWGVVQGTAGGAFNWSSLDREYQFTQSNNVLFKEHNFIWGAQQPSGTVGPTEVQSWMNAFCARYPNTKLIDVVNEPLHRPAPYANNIGGAGASGWDWIVNALKWARAACPKAILLVNDFNTIELQNDHNNFVKLVKAVQAAGAPIDGIGSQGHGAASQSTATVQKFIDDFTTQTGLPVYITEYDINIADDNQQMQVMQSQFTMFWNDDNVKGVTLWGYIEGETWETNTGLMSTSGTMRPAMTWLLNFLQTH